MESQLKQGIPFSLRLACELEVEHSLQSESQAKEEMNVVKNSFYLENN